MTFQTRLTFVLLGVLTSIIAYSQQFSLVDAGIQGVGRSSVAWGDYDADGDLDLLITGNQGSGPYVAAVYRNDEGNFIDIEANLGGLDNSSVAWGDFDNDGDLDILAIGRGSGSTTTWLYRNKNGVFSAIDAGFPDIGSYGCVAWGDCDGDGDLDALISGGYSCYLFKNNNGSFSNANASLPNVSNSWVNFGDFDNDGDQDIFVSGDIGGWPVSAICRNDNGSFTELDSTGILPFSTGTASWTDYDNDSDLDVLVSGFNQFLEPVSYIFRNDGDLSFINVWANLAGAALGTAAWGDCDNDGDADILITGQNASCGSISSKTYRNEGNGVFTNMYEDLEGVDRGSAAWGDYDNDGDLDIVISGFNGSGQPITKLYGNNFGSNSFTANGMPESPSNLNSLVQEHVVELGWNTSSDNSTPSCAISYNLIVGTYPGGQDVFAANSDPISSSRLVPKSGNMGNDTSWRLHLPDGTYYWSVQAVDHGFGSSGYAEEQTFTIFNVGMNEAKQADDFVLYPNPFNKYVCFSKDSGSCLEIFTSSGILLQSINESGSAHILPTDNWPAGIYYFKLSNEKQVRSRKLVKE